MGVDPEEGPDRDPKGREGVGMGFKDKGSPTSDEQLIIPAFLLNSNLCSVINVISIHLWIYTHACTSRATRGLGVRT